MRGYLVGFRDCSIIVSESPEDDGRYQEVATLPSLRGPCRHEGPLPRATPVGMPAADDVGRVRRMWTGENRTPDLYQSGQQLAKIVLGLRRPTRLDDRPNSNAVRLLTWPAGSLIILWGLLSAVEIIQRLEMTSEAARPTAEALDIVSRGEGTLLGWHDRRAAEIDQGEQASENGGQGMGLRIGLEVHLRRRLPRYGRVRTCPSLHGCGLRSHPPEEAGADAGWEDGGPRLRPLGDLGV